MDSIENARLRHEEHHGTTAAWTEFLQTLQEFMQSNQVTVAGPYQMQLQQKRDNGTLTLNVTVSCSNRTSCGLSDLALAQSSSWSLPDDLMAALSGGGESGCVEPLQADVSLPAPEQAHMTDNLLP